MNFSKWNLPNLKKTDLCTKAGRKLAYLCLKVFLILLLSGVVLGTAAGFGAFRGLIATAPDISSLSVFPGGCRRSSFSGRNVTLSPQQQNRIYIGNVRFTDDQIRFSGEKIPGKTDF